MDVTLDISALSETEAAQLYMDTFGGGRIGVSFSKWVAIPKEKSNLSTQKIFEDSELAFEKDDEKFRSSLISVAERFFLKSAPIGNDPSTRLQKMILMLYQILVLCDQNSPKSAIVPKYCCFKSAVAENFEIRHGSYKSKSSKDIKISQGTQNVQHKSPKKLKSQPLVIFDSSGKKERPSTPSPRASTSLLPFVRGSEEDITRSSQIIRTIATTYANHTLSDRKVIRHFTKHFARWKESARNLIPKDRLEQFEYVCLRIEGIIGGMSIDRQKTKELEASLIEAMGFVSL